MPCPPGFKYGQLCPADIVALVSAGVYTVDRYGDVWRNGRTVRIAVSHNGYAFVRLYHQNRRRDVPVHRLVWVQLTGLWPSPGFDVHHIDGNRLNNSPANLTLVDSSYHRSASRAGKEIEYADF